MSYQAAIVSMLNHLRFITTGMESKVTFLSTQYVVVANALCSYVLIKRSLPKLNATTLSFNQKSEPLPNPAL